MSLVRNNFKLIISVLFLSVLVWGLNNTETSSEIVANTTTWLLQNLTGWITNFFSK